MCHGLTNGQFLRMFHVHLRKMCILLLFSFFTICLLGSVAWQCFLVLYFLINSLHVFFNLFLKILLSAIIIVKLSISIINFVRLLYIFQNFHVWCINVCYCYKCTLSPLTVLYLIYALSGTCVATPALVWLPFSWNIFFSFFFIQPLCVFSSKTGVL